MQNSKNSKCCRKSKFVIITTLNTIIEIESAVSSNVALGSNDLRNCYNCKQ